MSIKQRICAWFFAPCLPSVELPAALPNGKPIWLVNDNGKLSTVQECPNCDGRGWNLGAYQDCKTGMSRLQPCNRCDTTGVIRG